MQANIAILRGRVSAAVVAPVTAPTALRVVPEAVVKTVARLEVPPRGAVA